ncbi:MAG: hypothetical protein F6K22_09990 [Okeania sp. SIO2F4]|uniref:hypothetical protein n=1 Tax=Okeania sp. SIO2F4 TaxID=2607790 RepID=UPI00142AED5D|nr:hypothetical protein [Okeania sp. SIO2F4]NES03153.1 hypothetical protein [Okeania sp. SIO2F4]
MLAEIVASYHPFADYLGYQEAEDGFIIHYQGTNGQQYMVIDTQGNVLSDTTLGTTRTLGALAVGAAILDAMFGGSSR